MIKPEILLNDITTFDKGKTARYHINGRGIPSVTEILSLCRILARALFMVLHCKITAAGEAFVFWFTRRTVAFTSEELAKGNVMVTEVSG